MADNSVNSFDYSCEYDPPAPATHLHVGNPDKDEYITTAQFLIDLGADITSISKEIFDILDLVYSGDTIISGVTGKEETRKKSFIKLESTFGMNDIAEAVVDSNPTNKENILGRDIINKWKITVDGPNLKTTFHT